MDVAALVLPWLTPALLGLVSLVPWRARGLVLRLAPLATLPALVVAWAAPPGLTMDVQWPLIGGTLTLDGLAAAVLRPLSVVWLAGALYGRAYPPTRESAPFWAAFLLAMAGNLGLVLAADAVEFYLFFALMSFSAYVLVVHDGSERARHAGRRYIQLVIAGEVLLFAGIVLAVGGVTADARLPAVVEKLARQDAAARVSLVLIVAGFAIKAGLVPVHVWLPLAHPAAPTPASAVLSGAMIKAGVIGWLRFLPLGQSAVPAASLLVAAGLGGALFAVARGLAHRDPKTILAYSSVSQMGAVAAAVGVGLGRPMAWAALAPAVLAYVAHHAVAKAALFLAIAGTKEAEAPQPRWRRALCWGAVVFPALALAGAPWSSGLAAKAALKAALPGDEVGRLMTLALVVASAATALLMGWYLIVLYHSRREGKPASGAQSAPAIALAAMTFAPVWSPVFAPLAGGGAGDAASWVALAAGAALAWIGRRRFGLRAYERAAVRAGPKLPGWRSGTTICSTLAGAASRAARALALPSGRVVERVEGWLEQPRSLALVFLVICVVLAALALT